MNCSKCNTEMFSAKLCADGYETGAFLTNKKKGLFEHKKRNSVSCYVCPYCGYIELYADNPKDLKLD